MTNVSDSNLQAAGIEAALKETTAALSLFPISIPGQAFSVNGGAPLQADGDDTFYSKKKVLLLLEALHGHLKGIEASMNAVRAPAFQQALDIRIAAGWQLDGNACPILYTDEINGQQVCRDDLWIATTAGLKGAPAPAEPHAIPLARIEQLAADIRIESKAEDSLRVVADFLRETAQMLTPEAST